MTTEESTISILNDELVGEVLWKIPAPLQRGLNNFPEEIRPLVKEELAYTVRGFFLLYVNILGATDTEKRAVFLDLLNASIAEIAKLFLVLAPPIPTDEEKEDIFGEYLKNMPLPVKSS